LGVTTPSAWSCFRLYPRRSSLRRGMLASIPNAGSVHSIQCSTKIAMTVFLFRLYRDRDLLRSLKDNSLTIARAILMCSLNCSGNESVRSRLAQFLKNLRWPKVHCDHIWWLYRIDLWISYSHPHYNFLSLIRLQTNRKLHQRHKFFDVLVFLQVENQFDRSRYSYHQY